MAAKGRALSIVLAIVAILASSSAFASIPRPTILEDPTRAIAFGARSEEPRPSDPAGASIDNIELLRIALDDALFALVPVESLPETRVWVSRLERPIFVEPPALLTHGLQKASVASWPGIASDPTVLTPDPLGYVDSSNLYAFAAGDPVNGRDPTGKCLGVDKAGRPCSYYGEKLVGLLTETLGLNDLPRTGSKKIDDAIGTVARAPVRVASFPATTLLTTGASTGELAYRMERSTFHGEQALDPAGVDDALLVAAAMGDVATVVAPAAVLNGKPQLVGSRESQRGSIFIRGRNRDDRGRFVIDPDNPRSPYVFTDAQRRASWKKLALDPESPLSAAERAEIKARGWRGPQRYNEFGELETMELSHEPVPLREGGGELVPRWPQEHAEVDPFRHLKKR